MRFSRGFSLAELLLALALGAVVLGAAGRMLYALRRFWLAQRDATVVAQTVRTATTVLGNELRAVSPQSGDLLRQSDTAVTIRAMRGLREVCAVPAAGGLVVRVDARLAPAAPVPGRDSLLVHQAAAGGDRWLHAGLTGSGGGTCTDGTAGRRFAFAPAAGQAAAFDSVQVGAPLRVFETLAYRLYNDGTGTWWLGVRSWQGASWAATSPIAGPLRARDGLAFRFEDGAGGPAADTAVRLIVITARAASADTIAAPGRSRAPHAESLTVRVAPRN